MLQKCLRLPVVALIANLVLVYLLFAVSRLLFVWCNSALYADHLDAAYLMQLMTAGLRFDTTAIIYLNCWLILAFLLPIRPKENSSVFYRVMRWMFTVVNSIALYANLADCAYFPYTGRRTTWSVLQEFGGEGNIGTIIVHEALPYWYLFIIGGVMTWMLWRGFRRPLATENGWRYYVIQTLSLVLSVGLSMGGIRGGFTSAVRPITISNANQYVNQAIDAGIVLNTPFSVFRTIGKKPFVDKDYMSEDEALALYNPLHIPADSVTFTPRNVVILILESFGEQAQTRGCMPFVDSLAHVGRSFLHSFSNGRKSIDGMPSVLSSIPSFVEPFFLTPASLNDLSGIAGELSKNKGYTSAFFHGAENGSMGFQAFANATGFQRYYGRTEYNQDCRYNGDADFDGTWAIWDEEFLQYYCDQMTELPEPFVTSVFTASSHPPFAMPERYRSQFPPSDPPIFASISYSDNAVRLFFEKAKRQPWFDNTIFVITADHTSTAVDPEYLTDLGRYRVPVIFYAPSMPELSGVDSTHIASQIDIMPTVLSLLGYDQPYIAFGRDALATDSTSTMYAVNYLPTNDWYQYIEGDWMVQFDGRQIVHAYRYREDPLQQNDRCGQQPPIMEQRLKSIIQQYMHRMNHNQMVLR
ncbi:MAG: sulfatase-like hydrolase/transferase [Bacteroidales bacterium]|nr:sulfatase-like hydrolase/transferase [Candidatus Liminaster caballi]